jgi:hypothetical protein
MVPILHFHIKYFKGYLMAGITYNSDIFQCPTAPSSGNDLTNKTYVDGLAGNPTPILYQIADTGIPASNIIYRIGDAGETETVNCDSVSGVQINSAVGAGITAGSGDARLISSSAAAQIFGETDVAIQSNSNIHLDLTGVSGDLIVEGLKSASTSNSVFYDAVTGKMTYNATPLQTITLTGDVTGSGTSSFATTISNNAVTTLKINNAAVTYAKVQNVAVSSLLGNPTASPAAPSEITLAGPLSFSGTTLTSSAFSNFSINVVTFNTAGSHTYTPSTNMKYCQVMAIAGGGGGGGAQGGVTGSAAGSGGASGGCGISWFSAATIGASKTVVVGAAGAAGAAGNNDGGNGGNTTFGGTMLSVIGGTGGSGCPNSASFQIMSGGSIGFPNAHPGAINIIGNDGGFSISTGSISTSIQGAGAPSPILGGGTISLAPNSTLGAGGAGAITDTVDQAGITGGVGACYIIEYILS